MIKLKNIFGVGFFLLFSTALQAQNISGEVFGGGHNGKVNSGNTLVYISTGEIGSDSLVGTPSGGIFGAGEGDSAIISGDAKVFVCGGILRNSVYGGGKRANLLGNSNVEIIGGTIHENVYGGARMANIKGYTYVYVHDSVGITTTNPVLGTVYGGNDIAGDVANRNASGVRTAPAFYNALPATVKPDTIPTTFVRIAQQSIDKQPFIGSLYGGSDGGYNYNPVSGGYTITLQNVKDKPEYGTTDLFVTTKPILDRTFIEFQGGTVGNMFAGGDNVTVTDAADTHLASNQLQAAATIDTTYFRGKDAFLKAFDVENYTISGSKATFTYQINRCFGGNNKAEMNIRPNWHLVSANVNNLYSGGNKGKMTYANGILIHVDGKDMIVRNVFGGCRLADVHPTNGVITAETINGFNFPAGYSTRTLITAGKIYNVYGGNDVSGQVYHGANVVIRSSIIENVYGSGNGSYAYYSNDKYSESDYYFQTNSLTGVKVLEALNAHRPNTENVLIDLAGTSTKNTFVAGNVFCGGNSATLRDLSGNLEYARAKVKIGSYVTTNGLFLGSNGEYMLDDEIISGINNPEYNPSVSLTDHDQMVEYMRGVEVAIKPTVEFDSAYVDYSTNIGSLYCGGNKGSMSAAGTFNIDFLKSVCIFDKLVGGSNDANVVLKSDSLASDGVTKNPLLNHSYVLGGLISHADPKVKMNITGLRLEPKKITYDAEAGTFDFSWNRYSDDKAVEGDMADYVGFLHGANIYGGCYSSGYINGGVQINIEQSVVTPAFETELKTPYTYKGKTYNYGWSDHIFEPFISTLTCYGGGYGEETEIWGNTEINVIKQARIMKVRGGGELGWVGKMKRNVTTGKIEYDVVGGDTVKFNSYYYNDSTKYFGIKKMAVEAAYNTTVHLNADTIRLDGQITNNVSEMVAGGFKGIVTGNTYARVDNGCVYTVFGGASNAHIYGYAETLVGKEGFPYVTQTVYGGNDFGGQIMGTNVYPTKNSAANSIQKVKCNTYVEYFQGEIGYNTGEKFSPDSLSSAFGIFGGGYGEYDYRTVTGNKYYGKATSQPNLLSKITIESGEADYVANCFVNISSKTTDEKDKVMRIYGGGQGYAGQNGVANTRQTYVLFNAANANARPNFLAQYVFGAGDCATTWYSRLDAYAGNANHVFGACRGVGYNHEVDVLGAKSSEAKADLNNSLNATAGSGTTAGEIQNLSYMGEYSVMNIYPTLYAPKMDLFASGAFSGTKQTYLNLYGGTVHDVYGASIEEGITYLTEVNVPKGSTLHCNGIYGGGKGLDSIRPCDTYLSTIKYHSDSATVEDGIYGGNKDYRFVRRTMIEIDVPVQNRSGELVNVYGAGMGKETISEIAFVNLKSGAKVKNVYGGSNEGKVYNKPSVIQYMLTVDYFKDKYKTGTDTTTYCLGDCEIGGFNVWKNQPGIAEKVLFPGSGYELTIGTLAPLSMGWAEEVYEFNTDVHIQEGAVVTNNVYGGGYGANATTAGCASIHLNGGTIMGNIYGGGYEGTVRDTLLLEGTTLANGTGPIKMNNYTKIYLNGGTCTNSYGSGLNGHVYGNTYTYVGRYDCDTTDVTYLDGDPTVERSLYGGGENGGVFQTMDYGTGKIKDGSGTANIYLNNGHIGYKYDAENDIYVTNVDYKLPTDSILYHNGNVFGGGYGEGANTINTNIIMMDGIVRNSLYGGGEIATIGIGSVEKVDTVPIPQLKKITTAGKTMINMYGGHVLRDVFGGGRGYSYNLWGDEVIGTRFYSDGYVFGQTNVNIYRGEIGTSDKQSLDLGYGNVFGGGNVGFVYSGKTKKEDGYYYEADGTTFSQDCMVLISPCTQVTDSLGVTVNGKKYNKCDFVPSDQLDYLYGKMTADSAIWNKMDYITGVTVHNAVFAGGNVTQGDTKLYADTKTVYGNASAVLNDVYNRDLITIGTEHTGGIYGDGNLTKVDGFSEICVINYGTDYYSLATKITSEEYYALNDRERSYFQLLYECKEDYGTYVKGQTIKDDIYNSMSEEEKKYWQSAGFCSVYAGRLLNTIQRADLVGVHGSRVVLQGAQDRTVSVVDYLEYSINRVGEVSLNRRNSVIAGDTIHGNYLGYYNTVNYLEALTSDVDFYSTRTTTNEGRKSDGGTTYGVTSYHDYKFANKDKTWRNNGTSQNMVALNSGIYLEIVSQQSTDSNKVYGPITGVIQLELMNTGEDLGGAFVYADNIHGEQVGSMSTSHYVSPYNADCATYYGLVYLPTTDNTSIESSGNFVHPTKPIVDDCYPTSTDVEAPGHYWFLRGSIYIYDQYISAYTGASTAYKADVQIPLTITAGTHGRLSILNIQPNLYAYYADTTKTKKLAADGDGVIIGGKRYHLNDVISYWDWSQLKTKEQTLFVHDTHIAITNFTYQPTGGGDSVSVASGFVMLKEDFDALPAKLTVDGEEVDKADVVRVSNGTNHTNGYALTADMSNPMQWDDRYTYITNGDSIINKEQYEALSKEDKAKFIVGPSFRAQDGVYGQSDYKAGDIISDEIHGAYTKIKDKSKLTNQAVVEACYITIKDITYIHDSETKRVKAGVGLSQTEYNEAILVAGNKDKIDTAYVCNSTWKNKSGTEYVITGEIISATKYNSLSETDQTAFSRAWICTTAGKYGGTEYKSTNIYDALAGWCDLTEEDREHFTFNYDALDLFINDLDPNATIEDYDKDKTKPYYARELEIDYNAIATKAISYQDPSSATVSYPSGAVLTREQYEAVPNEKLNYAYINPEGNVKFVVREYFRQGDVPFVPGTVLSTADYGKVLEGNRDKIDKLDFTGKTGTAYYYCKTSYTAASQGTVSGSDSEVTDVFNSTVYDKNDVVPVGAVISLEDYIALPSLQSEFNISGVSPTETSTLYVARDANVTDVMKDRVITVIYQYQYDETAEGNKMETITERHIVNIHLQFKSGAPSIGRLKVPGAVIPGTTVGLKQPSVTKGAYEILGGGWEIYSNLADADNHTNGQPYTNNASVLYFYQTGQYVTYYAKTYMGKTYSNAVPLTVANYHSINDVMADTANYMFIDHPDVPRNCKIYIDDDKFVRDTTKSEIDLLRDLYDLSLTDKLNKRVKGLKHLDFILQSDVEPKKYSNWTPLGSDEQCVGDSAFFHGDGYAITGMSAPLFYNYCGSIFNTGIKGSFTDGAGLATKGYYAANCWVWNEKEAGHTGKPILGNEGAMADWGTLYNCYYYENDTAKVKYPAGTTAIRKDETAFSNGEVAYDLNKYYLVKRFHDNPETPLTMGNKYSFWKLEKNNTLTLHDSIDVDNDTRAFNTDGEAIFKVKTTHPDLSETFHKVSYVEMRYWDGDFVNADGEIHTIADERYSDGFYYPIYPDDYIFFGQSLNYGYVDGMTHATYPTSVVKTAANRIQLGNNKSNRVFRAPAYFGSMDKHVAHFNVNCIVPYQYNKTLSSSKTTEVQTPATHHISISMSGTNIDTKKETLADGTIKTTVTTTVDSKENQTRTITKEISFGKMVDVYPNLTGLDFTGYKDYDYKEGTYKSIFYTPILDYKTLINFSNPDQSRNMLIYANSTDDSQGYDVLDNFLYEPEMEIENYDYNNVQAVTNSNAVQGHLVDLVSDSYITDRDHFIVDENNFHCPIPYDMGNTNRMWYQRTPCTYSDGGNGYESIVLPFTVSMVSAHQKGELTHFYDNDKNNHEYWLRGFKGITSDGKTLKFIRPMNTVIGEADGTDERYEGTTSYTVENSFLYDYYYSKSTGYDANKDTYQQQYYKDERTYSDYIYLTANVPYLMAFPGQRFYEFDMSGNFVPSNTFAGIDALKKQVISFVSDENVHIDTLKTNDLKSTYNNYTFKGIFQKVDTVTLDAENARIITTTGDKFAERHHIYYDRKDTVLKVMQPFHAYLLIPSTAKSQEFEIGNDAAYIGQSVAKVSGLKITTGPKTIYITNCGDEDTDVRVFNTSGRQVESATLGAGATMDVPVYVSGIYMVNNQKVLVK